MKIAAISIADYAEATEGMPHDVERLFFRMLLKMYSREDALPDSDSDNARIFGYDVRVYRRLKAAMMTFPCGMSIADGCIRNSRIDSELPAIAERRETLREAGRKGGKSKELPADFGRTSGELPAEVSQKSGKSPVASHMQHHDNSTTYDKPSPSPSPSPFEKEPPQPPKGGDDDMPSHVKPVFDWQTAFSTSTDHAGIEIDRSGRLVLVNGTHAEWLAKFDGDAEALALALTEVQPELNPRSGKSLTAQVLAKLARIVRQSREQTKRYERAAKAPRRSVFATDDESAARKRKLIETARRIAAERDAEAAHGRA